MFRIFRKGTLLRNLRKGAAGGDLRLEADTTLTPADFGRIVAEAGAIVLRARKVGFIAARQASKPQKVETHWNGKETTNAARPGDWTHAVMDVGATVCRPRNPRCDACPLRAWCTFAAKTASSAHAPATARNVAPAFASTTRWLRGRIVDRLRAAPDGAWTEVDAPIGSHDAIAVGAALEALARDGLVELDGGERRRARLATA